MKLTRSSWCQLYAPDVLGFVEGHVDHRCPKQTIYLHYASKAKYFSDQIFPKLSNSYVAFITDFIYYISNDNDNDILDSVPSINLQVFRFILI